MKIELEFISSAILLEKEEDEKIEFIINNIKKNKIMVLEESLSTLEEARLIEETMKQVNRKFPGIEISTMRDKVEEGIKEKIIRMLGGKTGGLTIIGPSKLIKKIKKEPTKISMLAGK